MELTKPYTFRSIPIESFKLLPRNGKLMLFVVVLSMILYSAFTSLFAFLIVSLGTDMITHSMPDLASFDANNPAAFNSRPAMDPTAFANNPSVKKDLALVMVVEFVAILVLFALLFLSSLSIIVVASASYKSESLSLKDFFSALRRKWSRSLATYSYVLMFVIVYFVVLVTIEIPLIVYQSSAAITVAGVLATVALGLFLYMSVPWVLAIVVSAVEDTSSGLDALGKASKLVNGKRAHGFLVNVMYCIMFMIIAVGCRMLLNNNWLSNHVMVYGFVYQGLLDSAKCFAVVAYTVLYFQSKKIHGEEVELYGSNVAYAKLPTTQKGSDMAA